MADKERPQAQPDAEVPADTPAYDYSEKGVGLDDDRDSERIRKRKA